VKRAGNLFDSVANFPALMAAGRKALRGKRPTPESMAFQYSMETECLALERELRDATYVPRPYRTFTVMEPKPRTISAAAMRDRVVHHALCAALEPQFERCAVYHSYACRPGKGSHAAVRQVQFLARRSAYFLKLDVSKFFETIDHDVLKTAIRRLVKDPLALWLVDLFIDHGAPGSPQGKGLPIGNLTSQYFANHYLSRLDHLIIEDVGTAGYVRYMDDMILLDPSKAHLRKADAVVSAFASDVLCVRIKSEATVLAPVSEGIPFLGLRIFPSVVRFGGPAKRRFIRGVRNLDRWMAEGTCDGETYTRSMASRMGMAMHLDTAGLRRSLFGWPKGGAGMIRARIG
jgi:hypothetical protein